MSKLNTVKLVVDIGKTIHDAFVAARDERGRRETEKRLAADAEKDRKIKELEAQIAAGKGTP